MIAFSTPKGINVKNPIKFGEKEEFMLASKDTDIVILIGFISIKFM